MGGSKRYFGSVQSCLTDPPPELNMSSAYLRRRNCKPASQSLFEALALTPPCAVETHASAGRPAVKEHSTCTAKICGGTSSNGVPVSSPQCHYAGRGRLHRGRNP